MGNEEIKTGLGSTSQQGPAPAVKEEFTAISVWTSPKTYFLRNKGISKAEAIKDRTQATKDNPEEDAQQYAAARRSILGEFSSDKMSVCTPCLANAKAASRKKRLDLVGKNLNCCEKEAKRLREDMDEVENMVCAKHVYLMNDPSAPPELKNQPPPGFLSSPSEEELAKMGLSQDMLSPKGSNFRASVYPKDPKVWAPPDPPDPKYVIAFRGTTAENEDWENDMMQGGNKTPGYIGPDGNISKPYYKRAVEIGEAVSNAKPSPSIHFVGHSLGGGLASAAQGGSEPPPGDKHRGKGKTASTYNAAGLNENTVENYGGTGADPSKIKAIRVKGEVLTKMQEKDLITKHLMPTAVGVKDDIESAHDKAYYLEHQGKFDKAAAEKGRKKFDADAEYSAYLHGMDVVIASIEARKKADQEVLEKCN